MTGGSKAVLIKDEGLKTTEKNGQSQDDTKHEINSKQNDLDELTYIISHDLQEPLRMITSYVQLLNKRYSDKLDDNAKEYIRYAVDGSNRLKQMMDDLLTYSRIGRPVFNASLVDLEEIIGQTKKHLKGRYKEDAYTIESSFTAAREITADRDMLIKLFYHIIDNAIKFNHNQKPTVEIRAQDEHDHWIISVKDDGMGIDKEYHGKIFGIFQKLHNHTEYPGSGIGLAICEKIAVKHNGRIWVDSEFGKGTTFYISLAKK